MVHCPDRIAAFNGVDGVARAAEFDRAGVLSMMGEAVSVGEWCFKRPGRRVFVDGGDCFNPRGSIFHGGSSL
eukprot:CAMPEP_0197029420 /NCGR_PEP_ID=MMETSP1384-20130603/8868_1 /TAXON_ID=29189 /ORGANISM="Ammonia sp." /LENGTH=71 /DNA_ID=CAMNT_0042458577 /DNA_START=64 /DNA_END=276 /DNA_ORIENTATION=+